MLGKHAGRASVELSGGITLENARAYAEAGADFIPEFGLYLVEIEGHLPIGSDLLSGNIRDDFLVGRPETTISIVAVL